MKLASLASTGVALSACRADMTDPPVSARPPASVTIPAAAMTATSAHTPTDTPTPQPAATVTPPPATPAIAVVQPAIARPEAFIRYAAEMRQRATEWGDQAYGAIVVRDGLVVGLGPSRVVINHDATAHAEMEAIRDASRRLGTADLSG
jgi:hypothetical protein